MVIQLQEYRAVIDNLVYERDGILERYPKKIPITEFILIGRYTEATEDDVVRCVMEVARKVSDTNYFPDPADIKENNLEELVTRFPDELIQSLTDSRSEGMMFIRVNAPVRLLMNGEIPFQYFNLRKGIVPAEVVKLREEKGFIKDINLYKISLENPYMRNDGFGENLRMKLLFSNGSLPDKKEIDILLKYGTYGSTILRIIPQYYNVKEVDELIDAVYSGIANINDFMLLKDVSHFAVEEASFIAISRLYKAIEEQMNKQQTEETFKDFVLNTIKFADEGSLSRRAEQRKKLN